MPLGLSIEKGLDPQQQPSTTNLAAHLLCGRSTSNLAAHLLCRTCSQGSHNPSKEQHTDDCPPCIMKCEGRFCICTLGRAPAEHLFDPPGLLLNTEPGTQESLSGAPACSASSLLGNSRMPLHVLGQWNGSTWCAKATLHWHQALILRGKSEKDQLHSCTASSQDALPHLHSSALDRIPEECTPLS